MTVLAGLLLTALALLPVPASADTILSLNFSPGLPGWNNVYTPNFFDCDSSPGACFKGNLLIGEILTLPADAYTFSFLAKTDRGQPSIFLYAWWNSAFVTPTSSEQLDSFTRFTYSGLLSSGGTNTLALGFSGGCGCVRWNIATPPRNVPEPSALALLATSSVALLFVGFRKIPVKRRS